MPTERSVRSWTICYKTAGGTSGDDAILKWLQVPSQAARFIRYWDDNIKGERMVDFVTDIRSYINSISHPPRSSEATYKRIQRWNQLLKLAHRMRQEGATEKEIMNVFPNYYGFVACLKRGMMVIRDQDGEKAANDKQQRRRKPLKSPSLKQASSSISTLGDDESSMTTSQLPLVNTPFSSGSLTRPHNGEGVCIQGNTSPSSSPHSPPMPYEKLDNQHDQNHQEGECNVTKNPLSDKHKTIKLLRRKNPCMHQMMETIQSSEKIRSYIEERKLCLSRTREMQTQIELVRVMNKAGFAKAEILSVIHKQSQPNNE